MQDLITPEQGTQPPAPAAPQHDGLSIAAFITVWFVPLLGAILGHVSNGQRTRAGQPKSGLAVAAVILGWIGTAFYALLVILFIAAMGQAANSTSTYDPSASTYAAVSWHANTHLNDHPDTTSVNAGAVVSNVWAYDNATEKFTITPEAAPGAYLVSIDYVGSFHGFADPRMAGELGGDGLGAALDSNGSVKGAIAYDVTVPAGQLPDPAALPGQVPSGTHLGQNITTLFDGNVTSISQAASGYVFTYHKVAGQDYAQVG